MDLIWDGVFVHCVIFVLDDLIKDTLCLYYVHIYGSAVVVIIKFSLYSMCVFFALTFNDVIIIYILGTNMY